MNVAKLHDQDIILVTGGRQTVSLVQGASLGFAEECIQLSEDLRENAKVQKGDWVKISKVAPSPARRVILIAYDHLPDAGYCNSPSFWSRLIGKFLSGRTQGEVAPPPGATIFEGKTMLRGDSIQVQWQGQPRSFNVVETQPKGVVIVTQSTEVTICQRDEAYTVSYASVGGLDKEVAKVREMVELPLRYPQIFQKLGIDPPKGLLLYGPPGCGKTLIARAVAYESKVHFINVNGPEIIQKHYGESEELLRTIFAEAQKHPAAIIFFDEIDAIAPNRETVLGDVEKRVVAQLLALMDGLHSRGQIIVIAATNLPNNVDPALRRPGRLDREIRINPPDKSGRLEILRIHTKFMPLAGTVDLEKLAALTHGFIGADIAALCREAAMACARDTLARIEFGQDTPEAIAAWDLRVGPGHFESALRGIEISTIRQMVTEVAEIKWEDVGGLEEIKQLLREAVEWPLRYGDRFAYARTIPPKGILLTGPTGTGKTHIAKAVATEAEVNFISVKGPELLSKWVGESERGIRELFKKARQSAPSILFFDEIDAIVPARSARGDGSPIGDRIIGQFLLELDSTDELHDVVVLAATNRPDLLDKALLRPGRFDYVVALPLPDYEARLSVLQIHSRERALERDVDLAALAGMTEGWSCADLEGLCRRAAMAAIRESISDHPEEDFPPFTLRKCHFEAAYSDMLRTRQHKVARPSPGASS